MPDELSGRLRGGRSVSGIRYRRQREGVTQEIATNLGMGSELHRRAVRQHVTIEENVGAITQRQRFAHVVIGEQDAEPRLSQLDEQATLHFDGERIDAGERLIRQQEPGVRRHTPGHFQASLLTAR